MGHSDSVTLCVYGHLFGAAKSRLTDKLDELRRATKASASDAVVDLESRREAR